MSLTWYFLVAVFFLAVVILSVPSEDHPATPETPAPAAAGAVPSE